MNMSSRTSFRHGLCLIIMGLVWANVHAGQPILNELQNEWQRAFPAPYSNPVQFGGEGLAPSQIQELLRPETPGAFRLKFQLEAASTTNFPADNFAILEKEFLLIRPYELSSASLSRSLQTIRDYPPPIRQAHAACVKIITPSWHGSGVIVSSEGEILTSYHLLAGVPGASIIMLDGRVYSVTNITAYSLVHDLALLKIPAATPVFLPVNNDTAPGPGSPLHIVGHPADTSWKLSSGTTIRHYHDGETQLLHFNSDIGHGNSGGPIIDEQGRLCAITACAAQLSDGSKVKVGVDIDAIRQFMSLPHNSTSFPGLAIQDKNRRMAEFMGTLYIVMEQWMRQWMADLSTVTLEEESTPSPIPGRLRLVHRQSAGDTAVKFLLLRSVMSHCSKTEGLDPQLTLSLTDTLSSLDHLIDGMADLRPLATPEELKQTIARITRHRDDAKLAFGKALGRLEETGSSLDLGTLTPGHQKQITILRKTYLPTGCHVEFSPSHVSSQP